MHVKSQYKPIPLYLQLKYCSLLSSRLKGFRWEKRDREASFRCPICGDSSSNTKKRSAYFYVNPEGISYHCFKHGESMSLQKFLKRVDESLYQDMMKDVFLELGLGQEKPKPDPKPLPVVSSQNTLDRMKAKFASGEAKTPLSYITRLLDLPKDHFARVYVESRQIPVQHHDKLWFVENYKQWIKDFVNKDSYESLTEEQMKLPDPRLVIPFFTKSGVPFAYQGRYLGTSEKATRYITVKDQNIGEKIPLIYGIGGVDFSKPVFVLEGPLDSLFVPNSVACAGTGLKKLLGLKGVEFVFCYDNQPRSKSVTKLYKKLIDDNQRIVIWNSSIKEKDVNDMIKAKELSIDKISEQLYTMSYQGFEALLQYDKWKKI